MITTTQFVTDFVKIVAATKVIPTDRTSTKLFLHDAGDPIIDLIFDVGGFTGAKTCCEAVSPAEVQRLALAAIPPSERIGDGKIWAWLQTVNWAQLIQTVSGIIAIIPKGPAA